MKIPAKLKESLFFTYLPQYADYLLRNKVDQYVKEALALSKEMDLPLLKYLAHIPEEALIAQSVQNAKIFLEGFKNNSVYEQLVENTEKWEANQLEIIEKDALAAEDIKMATYIRKLLLQKYIPEYTTDIKLIFNLVEELERYIYYGELVAFQVHIDIQNEKINQHVREIERINHQLQLSNELSDQAEAVTHIGNWFWDIEQTKVHCSKELYRIYGMEPCKEPITIDMLNKMLHPDDKAKVLQHVDAAIKNKSLEDITYRIISKDGKEKYVRLKGKIITDENNNAIEVLGTTQDITQQKKIDDELLEKQHFVQKIAKISPSIVTVYDIKTGKYSFINQTLKKIFGYDPDEALERGLEFFMEIMHPDDIAEIMQQNQEALEMANAAGPGEDENIHEFIYRMRDVNGNYRWLHTYGSIFDRNDKGEVEQVINVSVDITNEYELRKKFENEKVFADLLVESSPYMIMSYDLDFNITSWNKKLEDATGLEKMKTLGSNIFDIFPEYLNGDWITQMEKVFKGEFIHFPKIKFIHQPGYGECFVVPLRDAKQEVIGALTITNNITSYVETSIELEEKNIELQRRNKELVKSGNFLQTLIDSSPDYIFVADKDLKFVLLNKNAAAYIKTLQSVNHTAPEEIFKQRFGAGVVDKIDACLKGKFKGRQLISSTDPLKSYFQTDISPLNDENNEIYAALISCRDVSELVQSTEDLEEAKQKLEHINNELKKSEELYHKMVSDVDDYMIILLDKNGMIENWNKGAEKIKGYKAHEIIGKHFSIFYTKEDREKSIPEQVIETAFKNGKAEFEGWRVKKDGTLFWGNIVITPLFNDSGQLIGYSKISRDLTERKIAADNLSNYTQQLEDINQELKETNVSLQNARQQLADDRTRLLINAIPVIVAIASRNGMLEYTNPVISNFTGSTQEELMGHGWLNFIHPEDIRQFKQTFEDLYFNMTNYQVDFRLKREDGNYIWHHAILKPYLSEETGKSAWIITINNIHDQKLIAQKKDEFLGIASHELKTPLTSIKAYIELLKENLEQNKTDDLYFLTNKANHNINRLTDLIAELLDLTRIQHGKLILQFSEFDMLTTVEEVIEMLQPSARHQLQLSCTGKCILIADRHRLQQVVINLISNAIKYSPAADKIIINLSNTGNEILFSVQDFGIGIPKNDQEEIFTRFYRVEAHTTQFQGLGIGLFISAEIIRRHHGTIWVESTDGNGSTFYFKIPINPKITDEKINFIM